jgi:hypothetical protein
MRVRFINDQDTKYGDYLPGTETGSTLELGWGRFELMLSKFVKMMEQKRIIPHLTTMHGDIITRYQSWVVSEEHDEIVVNDTIAAWDKLITSIQLRLPGKITEKVKESEIFYSLDSIESCNIQGLFLKKFLQRVRIPSFKYVAPGLRVSRNEELSNQTFKIEDIAKLELSRKSAAGLANKWCAPFLFLRADKTIKQSSSCKYKPTLNESDYKYRGYPWEYSMSFQAGLYIVPTKNMEAADGCKLLTPFPTTPQKWARFGDGRKITTERQYDGLYQPNGWDISYWATAESDDLESCWNLRLQLLFENWTSMIENGHWQVGEDGVLGGIEKFQEANSEDKWNLYYIEDI